MKIRLLLLAVLVSSPFVRAQQDAATGVQANAEQARLVALGSSVAQAVYVSHMAINTLSDAWMKEAYTDEVALTLAASYRGGLGSMNQALSDLIEKGALSPDDLSSVQDFAGGGRLVEAQLAAFEEFVKTGDEAKARDFESKRLAARKHIYRLMGLEEEGQPAPEAGAAPNRLEFEILEAKMPSGGPGQLGTVTFERSSPDKAYFVNWQYTDGTSDKGLAVPFPGSKAIAVGFGPDVLGVAIYQLDGKKVDARWAPYVEDAVIGAYTMQQGENDSVYLIDGPEKGTFHFEEMEAGTAKLTWKYPSGELAGYGVAVGNHLAAVSVKPGGQHGIAIYLADPENGIATGKWTMENALGKVGEEKYRFVKAE